MIENNYIGAINIHDSYNIVVRNNTLINNQMASISFHESVAIQIELNYISSLNNGGGISVADCADVSIQDNTINADRNGISIYRSFHTYIRRNYLYRH